VFYDFRWIAWNVEKIEGHGLTIADVEYVVNHARRPYPKPIGNEKWIVMRTSARKMKNKKPLAPWLPGRFGRMTRQELDAESAQYDVEFSGINSKRVANITPHPPKRGRPAKSADEKAARVLITMTPRLLAAADAAADERGLTRAGLIREAVLDWLGKQSKSHKSA